MSGADTFLANTAAIIDLGLILHAIFWPKLGKNGRKDFSDRRNTRSPPDPLGG